MQASFIRGSVAIALSLVGVFALQGCAAETSDDTASADSVSASGDELLATNGNTGYFIVTRADTMRKCPAPACGGVFVKRVNQDTTRCADGTLSNECYVANEDLNPLGFADDQDEEIRASFHGGTSLVRATMQSTTFNGQKLGKLRVVEAWQGAGGGKVTGTFFRAADNGVRCIKAPCPSTGLATLNSKDTRNILTVNISDTGASKSDIAEGQNAVSTKEGILLGGSVAIPKCLPSSTTCGAVAIAEEFYLKATSKAPVVKRCGGLAGLQCGKSEYCAFAAGDMCGAADQMGTCTTTPQICFQVINPVCGCDDKTYGNSCFAATKGIAVAHAGACAK